MAKWTKRVTDLANATKADSKDAPKAPEPLKSFADWESHNELWLAYLATHRNPTTGVPLTYVLRETEQVDADALAETYDSIDDDLVATTAHNGDQFKLDCKRVFELYRPVIIDGPAWTFVKPTQQKNRNGREAYFVVKKQATGQAANTIRKKQAYAKITSAKYTGRGRFSLQQYILRHQQAHNTLSELGEAVAETKKVTDFLNGISDPSLTPAKLVVNGDEAKLSDFEQCQQYFQTVISATNNKKPKDRVRAGHYEMDEWNALNEDEKQQVFDMRKNKKDNKRKVKALWTNPSDTGAPPEKRARLGGKEVIDLTPSDGGTDEQMDEVAASVTFGQTATSAASAATAISDKQAESAGNDDDKDATDEQVTVTASDDLTDGATDGKPSATKSTATKFARANTSPAPSGTPDEYPKTQAGQNFGRFAHKKPATMDTPSVVSSVATTKSYPTYNEWQDGKKQPSKQIPTVPANCTLFEPLDLPIKEMFFHGNRTLPSQEKQMSLLKLYRNEGEVRVSKSVAWSWRWAMMTPMEKTFRLRYNAYKKLLEHTDKFSEAYRLSKEANDFLEHAETTPNKIGKRSRDPTFDVRDLNKKA
ncbi:hypothetical protein ACA910_001502 [Epithemia clementina (nom. ined.)]